MKRKGFEEKTKALCVPFMDKHSYNINFSVALVKTVGASSLFSKKIIISINPSISLSLSSLLQWVVGFGGFLLPCSPVSLRVVLKPLHVWLGASILTLSIAACISGINENLIFNLLSSNLASFLLKSVLWVGLQLYINLSSLFAP